MGTKMIDERQKLILWPLIEEFLDINPRECGMKERDRIEMFLSRIADIFDADRDFREIQLSELRCVVNDLENRLMEIE
jgi:hypothetical protein